MSGIVMRLLPRTDYNFNNVQASTSVIIWPTQDVDVSRYREGTLLVRVHANTIGTTATFIAALRASLPSKEDPAQFFRAQSDLAYVQIVNSTPAPSLQPVALPAPFGGFVSLQLRASQPASTTNLSLTISVDLSLKD